jgi:hypothetical protein
VADRGAAPDPHPFQMGSVGTYTMIRIKFTLLNAPDGIAVRVDGKTFFTGYTYQVAQDTAAKMMELSLAPAPTFERSLSTYNKIHGFDQ